MESRMFFMVSMESGGEAVFLCSLLPGLGTGVLDWMTVGSWSDSLPNAMRAFPKTFRTPINTINIKAVNKLLQRNFFCKSSTHVWFNRSFWTGHFSWGPELVWIWSAEARERENVKYSVFSSSSPSSLHLPLHIDLINSQRVCTGQTTLRPLSVSFPHWPLEQKAGQRPISPHRRCLLCVQVQWYDMRAPSPVIRTIHCSHSREEVITEMWKREWALEAEHATRYFWIKADVAAGELPGSARICILIGYIMMRSGSVQ